MSWLVWAIEGILHSWSYTLSITDQPVPWLVADGYIANYQEVLNALLLILVTSNRVKEMYVRDGSNGDISSGIIHHHVHGGLVVKHKPYYAFWSYKIQSSERFDLLGQQSGYFVGNCLPELMTWFLG